MTECIHGLVPDQCSWCSRPSAAVAKADKLKWITAEFPTTNAQFEGDCPSCRQTIELGDPIYLIEDEGTWICQECVLPLSG